MSSAKARFFVVAFQFVDARQSDDDGDVADDDRDEHKQQVRASKPDDRQ